MTDNHSSIRALPEYFEEIRSRTEERWKQRESDAESASVWNLLFSQIQSPRHVLSELLQNADDAGATRCHAEIDNGFFIFEHNGKDFDYEQFDSLCHFGLSNKRHLHTIGFRGIGFKTTFSLGDTVELVTPSLSVRFFKKRFTLPLWFESPLVDNTRIAIQLKDENRTEELRRNLAEWTNSPTSLLFFNNICEISIGQATLTKDSHGDGPIPNSKRTSLKVEIQSDVFLFKSELEPFPRDAITEVRQERGVEDFELPSCSVEVVLGLAGSQRLYTVLPTGVRIIMPFSCNAPFLQDSSRNSIKSPSTSPTNRWLLMRIGKLAADSLKSWLGNESLSLEERAQAYELLPPIVQAGDSIEADAAFHIFQAFRQEIMNSPILLATNGRLVRKHECIAPPDEVYGIWPPETLLRILDKADGFCLSEQVKSNHREALESWELLESINSEQLIRRLKTANNIPKPETYDELSRLWQFIVRNPNHEYGRTYESWQDMIQKLSIVPVESRETLCTAKEVVRRSSKKDEVNREAFDFLTRFNEMVDSGWPKFLQESEEDSHGIFDSRQLLKYLKLDEPTSTDIIVANACRRLFSGQNPDMNDCIKMTHIMAHLRAKAPKGLKCFTRDGKIRDADGVVATLDKIDLLFPASWSDSNLLHESYFTNYQFCAKQEWEDWLNSVNTSFVTFAHPIEEKIRFDSQRELEECLKVRGVEHSDYPYRNERYFLKDFDFDEPLLSFWNDKALNETSIWSQVMERLLKSPPRLWRNCRYAGLEQMSTQCNKKPVDCGPIPAAWIMRFAELPCLPDTRGNLHVPAELYLRTQDTEPLMDVEPFVKKELDNESTRNLLKMLGVRNEPGGLDSIIDRIRTIVNVDDLKTRMSEVTKWYRTLDRVFDRCNNLEIYRVRNIFAQEKLILNNNGEWVNATEVYLDNDYSGGEFGTVHNAVNDLTLWAKIGVANSPSENSLVKFLKQLPSGKVIEPSPLKRVKSALGKFPERIWEETGHWLTLDNRWVKTDDLKFRLTMQSLVEWSGLFPHVKLQTADFRMLPVVNYSQQPFSELEDLSEVLEYRNPRIPINASSQSSRTWLVAVGRQLMRLNDSDPARIERIREEARRLVRSKWQTVDSLRVTPYIDGSPAGEAIMRDVFWQDDIIYVIDERPTRLVEKKIRELADPFDDDKIRETMKFCYERDDSFIEEYFAENFDLESFEIVADIESEADVPKEPSEPDEPVTAGQSVSEVPEEPQVERPEEPITKTIRIHERERGSSLFERFAGNQGYAWDEQRSRFCHEDGSWIVQAEGHGHWKQYDRSGQMTIEFWALAQCLSKGVEIYFEIWDQISTDPDTTCLVLQDENGIPYRLTGRQLLEMKERGQISLFPARYRIRAKSD